MSDYPRISRESGPAQLKPELLPPIRACAAAISPEPAAITACAKAAVASAA